MTKPIVLAEIATPYLCGRKWAQSQTNPKEGTRAITRIRDDLYFVETQRHNVFVGFDQRMIGAEIPPKEMLERLKCADIVISGSAYAAEANVRDVSWSGLIVGRYSKFYGGPSEYTRRLPAQSGYAFDIPHDYAAVIEMLTYDDVLEAILARDVKQIRTAVDELNKTLYQPVHCTEHLATAVQIPKEDRASGLQRWR